MAKRGVGAWIALIGAVVVGLIGLPLAIGGFELVGLGGSPYYLIAGAGLVVAGVLLALRRPQGGLVYGLVLLATLAWAVWEAGLAFWPLLPRLFAPAVVGIIVLLVLRSTPKDARRAAMATTGAGVVLALVLLGVGLSRTYGDGQARTGPAAAPLAANTPAGDWRYYGRDAGGQRFAPSAQINTRNVGKLKVAWTLRTGDIATGGSEDQNTPIQVGDTVYACTPRNIVIAIDADTGQERWRHDPKVKPHFWNRCRGVGYYEAAKAPGAAAQPCDRRIVSTTIDARMFALDAPTGQACPGFGQGGVVDLKAGMGEVKAGFYFPTSTPTVAGDRIIVGGWVMDNRELGEPSGVVRAFSAETGALIWAWDLGDPTITGLPPEGGSYT
ncbi:MAG: PQQ-binding-like beta-propeller repeat protein, partial [Phenylobacterium sp.]